MMGATRGTAGTGKLQSALSGRLKGIKRGVPQVLGNEPASYAADLWALGCILYQMLVGKPPFKGASEYLTLQKVTDGTFTIPEDMPEPAADLIKALLQPDPNERLGSGPDGIPALKAHPFFIGTPPSMMSGAREAAFEAESVFPYPEHTVLISEAGRCATQRSVLPRWRGRRGREESSGADSRLYGCRS